MKTIDIDAFVLSYLATAAWVTCESSKENHEFTEPAKHRAMEDCEKFIHEVQDKLGMEKANELLTIPGNDLTYLAPHDFFLTRNRHGAGFWDKPEHYGEYADILTEIAQAQGTVDCGHIGSLKSKLSFD